MALVEIRRGFYLETEPVEHEPGCVRLDAEPGPAFRDYLLPRLQQSRDEASAEVLAAVRAGRPFGDAVLDAIESLPAHKTRALREWVEEARATRIYAYVEFYGRSRMTYGLMKTAGGPRDKVLDSEEIETVGLSDDFATFQDFPSALDELRKAGRQGSSPYFEDVPFVLVEKKRDYDEALKALGIAPEDGAWEKAGLYDFRDEPPTFGWTEEDYLSQSMRDEAEQAFDMMYQDDEWQHVCERLLEGYP
jgi:hypothetical protein